MRNLILDTSLAGLLLTLATSAYASDGVLEINQACAVNTGCFPGDDPGFPVTVVQPGSYSLTIPDEIGLVIVAAKKSYFNESTEYVEALAAALGCRVPRQLAQYTCRNRRLTADAVLLVTYRPRVATE